MYVVDLNAHRRELLAHCYRMTGSVVDAEDLVQETMLRAWRAREDFDPGRASLRTWLYRIATNVCLTALERRTRRPLPSGLGGDTFDPDTALVRGPEVPWLQPIPDALITDPAAVVASRGSVRLALVAAMQHLSARQRAVLILRDVLAWPAAEVADLLDVSVAAVNSLLQRARTQLASVSPAEDDTTEPASATQRATLDQFAAAFENADAALLTRLLAEDVTLEMPPHRTWFAGRHAVGTFLGRVIHSGSWRLHPTRANGSPAFGTYLDGHVHGITVLELADSTITRIVAFHDPALFKTFAFDPH
ncbi:RNA polymerase subunit sigma-70 [Kutzneria sp. CA-103260]|uniref:RNA polymerase subunit sigma-70 n=1 Tax=Kutzneria sp. CA-103260 TaxID=2802641 RepID=UPI001BF0E927|nr:RNA polymerase subunit sigma-70 [Kutzneria sp. CA-103260]QUQ62752.1 ECF subfamily RNA polymerase sigma-70 factor [Kutzneria sp. CA-103260]